MVLAFPVGRQRNPWRGFWLAVATFTLYRYYWDIKAHDELYQQYELARERRDMGTVWYVFGFLVFILRFVYYAKFAGNVEYLHHRLGWRPRISRNAFLALVITGEALWLTGLLASYIILIVAAAGVGPDESIATSMIWLMVGVVLVGLVARIVLLAFAYIRLQEGINVLWSAYYQRAQQLVAHSTPPPPTRRPPSAAPPGSRPNAATAGP